VAEGGNYERSPRNSDAGRLDRIWQDIYYGNGKPGLTTRMLQAEDRLDMLEAYNTKTENRHEAKLNLIIGAAFSCLGAIVTGIILFLAHAK
jgi:hypothetical protein